MASVSKRKLNSKIVKIKAPVMMVQQGDGYDTPVWMDRHFFPNLLDRIKKTGIEFKHNAVKITFKDYKHATKFRLIYEKTPEIF
jgi:hypothetical protein